MWLHAQVTSFEACVCLLRCGLGDRWFTVVAPRMWNTLPAFVTFDRQLSVLSASVEGTFVCLRLRHIVVFCR